MEIFGRKKFVFPMAAVLFVATLLFCGFSFAAEAAHGDESGALWDLLYRFINFGLLVIILVVVLKKANIKGLLASRSEELRRRLSELRTEKGEAERRYGELEKRIKEFEKSRGAIIDQFRAEGMAERQRLIADAEKRVKQLLEQAETAIQREIESAKSRLRKEMIGIATQNAEEILSKKITESDQDRLVDEFIERVGKTH